MISRQKLMIFKMHQKCVLLNLGSELMGTKDKLCDDVDKSFSCNKHDWHGEQQGWSQFLFADLFHLDLCAEHFPCIITSYENVA